MDKFFFTLLGVFTLIGIGIVLGAAYKLWGGEIPYIVIQIIGSIALCGLLVGFILYLIELYKEDK